MARPAEKTSQEKREFFRLNFTTPLEYRSYKLSGDQDRGDSEIEKATSQNISQAGILFNTKNSPPELSSFVWLSLDLRTLRICQEIEARALVVKNGLLGRVVRVEENPQQSDSFDVGVCFLTKDNSGAREVQTLLQKLSKE